MDAIAWRLHVSEEFLSEMKNLKQTKKKEKIPRTDVDIRWKTGKNVGDFDKFIINVPR